MRRAPPTGAPLLDVIYGQNRALLDQTAYTQPALFSIEWALAQLWKSWGIQPDVVLGHSVGEYAALCVAGVWTLEDGLRLIAERGRLMQSARPRMGHDRCPGSALTRSGRLCADWRSLSPSPLETHP